MIFTINCLFNMDFNYLEHYKTDANEFDYFEERKGATAHDERRVREFIISLVEWDVKSILDIGCGSAWVAEFFTNKSVKVYSFDISLINTIRAKEKVPDPLNNPLVGDAFSLPLRSHSIDCVIASEVIEHVIDPKLFVKELFRVVKPGGSVIITTPYKEVLRYSLCIHCNKKTPINAHLHSFDENVLSSLIDSKDLDKVTWKKFGNKVLIYLRTYIFLKFLPFSFWKYLDKAANFLYNHTAHIIVRYKKK